MTALPPLRAPSKDGEILAVPPLMEAGPLIEENRDRLRRMNPDLLDAQSLARQEMLAAARAYSDLAPDVPRVPGEQGPPLLLAGHQPELFHPGVWIKNFALAGLARRHHGIAVNLIIDNDTVKSTAVNVPVQGHPWPHTRTISYDRWQGEVPWEERRIADPELFARFADEVAPHLRAWGYEPLLPAFWAEVRRQTPRYADNLGESFAAARRALERNWGCRNLEVPLSHLCRGEAFAWLVGTLLSALPRFVGVYNTVVREHRRQHGIRSRHHPVPDLASEGDWLELPLWGWQAGQPRRARLFARLHPDHVELRAGERAWPRLPAPRSGSARFVEAWRNLEATGHKVRTRALGTTLFSRLLLADLFVHGIGGGKYDELTDALMHQFWGVHPPRFLVLTATRLLPLPSYPATRERRRELMHQLRELHFNPQRHLTAVQAGPVAGLLNDKQEWIARAPETRAGRRERFRTLVDLTSRLRPPLGEAIEQARRALDEVEQQLEANVLLHRRDYPFCVHPEEPLRALCTRLLESGVA